MGATKCPTTMTIAASEPMAPIGSYVLIARRRAAVKTRGPSPSEETEPGERGERSEPTAWRRSPWRRPEQGLDGRERRRALETISGSTRRAHLCVVRDRDTRAVSTSEPCSGASRRSGCRSLLRARGAHGVFRPPARRDQSVARPRRQSGGHDQERSRVWWCPDLLTLPRVWPVSGWCRL